MTRILFGLEAGSALGEYRIERLLGSGETGSVFLAEHVELRRRVALKLLDPELAGSDGLRARFLGDCEIAATLDHPNVLPVYDAGEVDGVLYVAMRYVEGSDLRAMLGDGALSTPQAAAIVEQVAGGLHAAHCCGLVHRDVKPANIRVEAGTHGVFVSDFGLGTSPPRPGVTIDYCAPERIEGKRLDGRADVYSLGCVLFHCVTGCPPVAGSPRAGDLPAPLDRVVASALARDPADRYSTTVELAEASRAAVASQPARTPVVARVPPAEEPEPPAAAQPPQRRRRRNAIIAGAALLLAAGAIAGALAISPGGSQEPRIRAATAPPILPHVTAPIRATPTSVQQVLTQVAAMVRQRRQPHLFSTTTWPIRAARESGTGTPRATGAEDRCRRPIRAGETSYPAWAPRRDNGCVSTASSPARTSGAIPGGRG